MVGPDGTNSGEMVFAGGRKEQRTKRKPERTYFLYRSTFCARKQDGVRELKSFKEERQEKAEEIQ